jgi:glutathione S-transferase
MKPTLLIANKNYSSWSLRAWLVLRHAGIDFDEQQVLLGQADTRAKIAALSPSGKVPAFKDGALVVWDSLAICEYLAEKCALEKSLALWPADPRVRAVARAVSAEMHSGFQALRSGMPMNLRAVARKVEMTAPLQADIDRIERLWADCRARFSDGGPWLFGHWSIADAMYAPVAARFVTYGVERAGVVDDYLGAVFGDPAFQEWRQAALAEDEVLAANEVGKP